MKKQVFVLYSKKVATFASKKPSKYVNNAGKKHNIENLVVCVCVISLTMNWLDLG